MIRIIDNKQNLLLLHTKVLVHSHQSFKIYGRLTEWLGSGLQNRLRRFESATDLNQSLALSAGDFLVFVRSIQNVLTPFPSHCSGFPPLYFVKRGKYALRFLHN